MSEFWLVLGRYLAVTVDFYHSKILDTLGATRQMGQRWRYDGIFWGGVTATGGLWGGNGESRWIDLGNESFPYSAIDSDAEVFAIG